MFGRALEAKLKSESDLVSYQQRVQSSQSTSAKLQEEIARIEQTLSACHNEASLPSRSEELKNVVQQLSVAG